MKCDRIGGLAIFALLIAVPLGTAGAADMPVKAPPLAPQPVWSWTGFYIGGNVGAGWANGNTSAAAAFPPVAEDPFTISLHGTGAVGGVQAGYNWQINPSVLIGLEGDWDAANINASNSLTPLTVGGVPFPGPVTATASRNVDWLASIRGRLGITFNQTLLYVTGGGAWSRMSFAACQNCNLAGGPISYPTAFSAIKSGGVVGAGIEQAIAANWSVRAEYLYYRFDGASSTAFPNPGAFVSDTWARPSVQTVRVGVNLKLGGPLH
jgi:outer membrane immunogenic protein